MDVVDNDDNRMAGTDVDLPSSNKPGQQNFGAKQVHSFGGSMRNPVKRFETAED